MAADKAEPKSVSALTKRKIEVLLRGQSMLVTHCFSEKVKKEILDKQMKKTKEAKVARDPRADFLAARYLNAAGLECVPITALKKALVNAAVAFDDLKKTELRQALFVDPVGAPGAMLVPIETHDGAPAVGVMREDPVTIGMGKRGLTYRPSYEQWQVRVTITFNERLVSEEQLLALIEQAGWGVGICEGRPEKTSALGWGRFERVVA